MAQQVVHAKVHLPDGSTFEDTATIGTTFEATGSNPNIDLSILTPHIVNFFNTVATGAAGALASRISGAISRAANAITIDYTDVTGHLDGSPAGGPFHTDSFTLAAAGESQALPPGIAICCGYRSNYGSDLEHGPNVTVPSTDDAVDQGAPATHTARSRPRARDRNRFYLGPLAGTASENLLSPGTDPTGAMVQAQTLTDVQSALSAYLSKVNSGQITEITPVVWSRRNASVNAAAFLFVDEGLCYQRRREDDTLNRVHTWISL